MAHATDAVQRAVFGVSVVSSDAKVCDSVLEQVAHNLDAWSVQQS